LCQNDPAIPVDLSTRVNSGGLNVQWFNESTGGEPLDHIPSISNDGVSIYYAGTLDGVTGCQSLTRTKVTVTIKPQPADPVWISDKTECVENPAQVLRAAVDVPADGAIITWYDAATAGNLVASPILNHVGTISYWAQANLGTCASANRTMVTLTIEDVPVPPVLSGASNELLSCETPAGIDANDAIIVAPMTTIKWFDKAVNGVEVSPVQIVPGVRMVYAEAIYSATGCSSLSRTAVKLTILKAPAAPASAGDIFECAQSPLQVLDANKSITPVAGTSVVWYNQASGGTVVVNPTLNITNSTVTYYAQSIDNVTSCTSLTRTAVKLSLSSITASAASNSPISLGQTLQLKGGPDVPGNTFVWTGPNGFNFSTMDVTVPNATEAAAGRYKLTVTSALGCSATDSVDVVMDIARAEAQLPVCIGSTLYLSGYPDNMQSYAWSGPNGYTSTDQNPSINNVSIANSGVYTLIVTNANNATSSDTVSVSFKPLPIPIAEAVTVCPAGTMQLKAGPNGMTSYTWSDQNGSTWNQQNPPVMPFPNPPQTFKLTVVDWNGCEASKTITPVPFQPRATSNSPVCGGDTLRLRGEPNGMASYKWTGPNGFVSNLQSPSLNNVNPATATGDYTLTVVDKAGCTFSTKVTVSFYPAVPIPTIVPNINPVCEGGTLILKGGPSGMSKYEWTGPDGFESSDQNPQITNMTGVNAGKYTLRITNVNGCRNVFQTDIAVTTVTFNGTYGPFCISDAPMPLSVTPNGGTFTGPGMKGNVFDPKLAGVGTHPIQYTLPGGGCTVTKFIEVVTAPKLVITNPVLKSCTGTTADLTLPAVTKGSTPGLFLSYWTDINATSALSSPKSVSAGLYYIKGTTSGGKCSDIKPVMVTQPDSLRANVIMSSELNCKGDSTGALTVNITLGTAPYTYQWSTVPVQTTPTISNLPSGTYTVLITDAKMCAAAFTGEVLEPAPLNLGFAIKSIQCMSDINGTARVDTINGITDPAVLNSYKYEWDTTPVQTTREATRLSAWWQRVTLTSPKGCIEKDSVFIDVLDATPPVIDCPKDVDMTVSYIKSPDGSPNKYTVKLGQPLVSDNCAIDTLYNDAPAKFRKGLTYVVWTATDQVGLVDTCTQRVYIKELPTAPQLITPNGDGLNDTFVIAGLNDSDYKDSHISIFTRSGQLVFQNNNYELLENAWDGRYQESTFAKNNIVAPGIYFYILNLGGPGGQMMKGYVYVYY
jgi:gliding motility-associated-like protein